MEPSRVTELGLLWAFVIGFIGGWANLVNNFGEDARSLVERIPGTVGAALSLIGVVALAVLLARQWHDSRPSGDSGATGKPETETRGGDVHAAGHRDKPRRPGIEDRGQVDEAAEDVGIPLADVEEVPTPLAAVPYVKDGVFYGWATQWSARDFYAQLKSSNKKPYQGPDSGVPAMLQLAAREFIRKFLKVPAVESAVSADLLLQAFMGCLRERQLPKSVAWDPHRALYDAMCEAGAFWHRIDDEPYWGDVALKSTDTIATYWKQEGPPPPIYTVNTFDADWKRNGRT